MSLKAKIEAVIYASEEPVTLAQLVGLLGEEGQAELDALRSRQSSLALEDAQTEPEAGDHDALNSEVFESEAGDADEENADEGDADEEDADQEAPAEAGESADAPEVSEGEEPAAEAVGSEDAPEREAGPEAAAEPVGAAVVVSEPEAREVDEKMLAREAAAETKARERALRDHFRGLLEQLMSDYVNSDRGLEIREVAGGYRLATKPEYHDAVRGFVKSLKPPLKLSLQALETLAVVAYKQPVTAPEISEIRGVDSGGVLGGLMARKLVTTAGRKQVIGRPILYKTTKDFLVRFGLKDINELPSIEEFEKMAGELADADPVQEEIQMEHGAGESQAVDEAAEPETTQTLHETAEEMLSDKSVAPEGSAAEPENPKDVEPMADVHEPQPDGDSTPTEEEQEAERPQGTGA